MQDYKSLCLAVMICTLINKTHKHTHTHPAFGQLYY